MPPSAQDINGPDDLLAAPDPARTRFTLASGNPSLKLEDHLVLPYSSPLVTPWSFMDWKLSAGPPSTASAPRSKVAAALLQGTRRPTLLDASRLQEWSSGHLVYLRRGFCGRGNSLGYGVGLVRGLRTNLLTVPGLVAHCTIFCSPRVEP